MGNSEGRLNRLEKAEGDPEEVQAFYVSWAGIGEEDDPETIVSVGVGGQWSSMTLKEFREKFPQEALTCISVVWKENGDIETESPDQV